MARTTTPKRTAQRKPAPARGVERTLWERFKAEPAAIESLCAAVKSGTTLTAFARKHGVVLSTLLDWIAADPDRSARARDARTAGALAHEERAEEVLLSARNPLELAKAKELAHHLRWRASKADPRQFGEKLDLTSGDKPLRSATDAEILSRLAAFGVQAAITPKGPDADAA